MVKLYAMLKRKSNMTFDEFKKYYYETHGPLALRLMPPSLSAGLKTYTHNYVMKIGESEPRYDVVMETVYSDLDCWKKCNDWYLSEAGKPLRDDEENFIDWKKSFPLITDDERVLLDNRDKIKI